MPHSWFITGFAGFVTRLTWRVPLMEQELLTLPEHLSSPPGCSCYSIFSCICMFCWSLFVLLSFFFWPLCCLFFCLFRLAIVLSVLLSFSFGHCVVCSSVFFVWPLCCLFFCLFRLAIALSVLLSFSFGHCVVCSSVFFVWPLCCLFFDIRILITPLVYSNSSSIVYSLNVFCS